MRFQGACLVNEEGWRNMYRYNFMPSEVRAALQASLENLCPMCLVNFVAPPGVRGMLDAVRVMEEAVRAARAQSELSF